MKRGCLRNLVVLAAATALWGFFLVPRISDGDTVLVLTICGGLLTSVTVWTVWKIGAFRKDAGAINTARAGRPPVAGGWYAALGEIHPLPGGGLAAPFSGRPAVAYEYDVTRWKERHTSKGQTQCRAYFGSALAPCEIRTMAGPIRLFGMPYLDVESTAAVGPDVRRGADLWVSSTAFSETGLPRSIAELKADAAEMAESTDSVGVFRQDYRSDPDATLDGWTLSEKVVPPGQKVCVLGLYSAARGGLEPPPVEAAETLRLLPGDTPKALELSTDRAGCLRFALVLFVLCQGALLWFAPSRRETSSTMTDWIPTESDLFRAAGEGDAERVRLILGKKTVGPSPQDTIGRTPAHVAANPATLQVLLDAGAPPGVEDEFGVTPLMLAASEGDVLKVRLLLERGVAVDAHTRQGVTALSLAEEPATRKLLEKAGAPGAGPWDGVGSPIPGNGEDQWKVVLAYVEAIE
ncbi:MAG TPA: ankyrin repeat domain-containing protein, partial [Thermoanaerobaculia bacterium]